MHISIKIYIPSLIDNSILLTLYLMRKSWKSWWFGGQMIQCYDVTLRLYSLCLQTLLSVCPYVCFTVYGSKKRPGSSPKLRHSQGNNYFGETVSIQNAKRSTRCCYYGTNWERGSCTKFSSGESDQRWMVINSTNKKKNQAKIVACNLPA